MRLFVALDIPNQIRQAIGAWVEELRRLAPDARWVRPESYHVTLKFIGEWRGDVRQLISALEQVGSGPVQLSFRNCGFFPHPRSPRVFWIGIDADSNLAPLAHTVDEACSALGIARDDRDFSPHLTLARSASGSPRPRRQPSSAPGMKLLSERITAIPAPDFGTMHATEFFLYESQRSPGGAKYAKLKNFALDVTG